MTEHIIAVVGGSGSGKSTLSYGIQDKYPDLVEVLHFDDYQKEEHEIEVTEGMRNWDHPSAIDFDKLINDLKALKEGNDVEIMTKSRYYNPEYEKRGRIPHTIHSKKIVFIEGYLVLHDKGVRELLDYVIFLDLDADTRMKRRNKFIYKEYTEKILIPMHNKYVQPTKKYADFIIDVGKIGIEEAQKLIIGKLKENKIINR